MDALRDWGHARDYVELQWLMLQQDKPDDYVIASGHQISVRDFVKKVSRKLEMQLEWQGNGLSEKVYWKSKSGNKRVLRVDPQYYRPTEVDTLLGDTTKAQRQLGWKPKSSINQLIEEMIEYDLKLAHQKQILAGNMSK